MTKRENMLRALRRERPEKVPFEFVLCPSQINALRTKIGTQDYMEYFEFPFRYIELNQTIKKTNFTKYYKRLPTNATPLNWNSEWGIYGVNSEYAHFQEMLHPMKELQQLSEIFEYPWPDLNEDYRWEGIEKKIKDLKNQDLVAVAFMQMTIFEIAWYLRGMENFMIDLIENEPFANALLDEITKIRIGMAEKYARAGVDILMLGDDVSTQLDMMLNPYLWRKTIKPKLASVILAAKAVKSDILIFYHGDGNLQKIIPDLIELGVDILNPVQPECMDPVKIKELYGSKLSFWGTLGTQTSLPFGNVNEVKEKCKNLIEKVGRGGGLLLAPTHIIEPDVPWENVEAFIEAVLEYGHY